MAKVLDPKVLHSGLLMPSKIMTCCYLALLRPTFISDLSSLMCLLMFLSPQMLPWGFTSVPSFMLSITVTLLLKYIEFRGLV